MKSNVTAAHTGITPLPAITGDEPVELTMEALMAQYPMPVTPQRFETVKGYVVSKTRSGLLVDIGGKTESFCDIDQAGDLNPGDTAEFLVIPGLEDGAEDGAVRLSYVQQQGWSAITSMQSTQTTGIVRVVEVLENGAGLTIECNGLRGFLPRSEVDVNGRLDSLAGKEVPVKVLTAERGLERGRFKTTLIVSHKQATRETKLAFLDTLKVGDTIEGTVTRILFDKVRDNGRVEGEPAPRKEMGALIDLGNLVVGFVHRSEASFSRSVKPSDVLPVGEVVKATILDINRETLEIKLSTKKHTMNRDALSHLKPSDKVSGTVSHVLLERVDRDRPSSGPRREIGLLVDLGNRLTGFIHPREVSPDPLCVASQHLPVGTQINGEVVSIDERTGQIKINLNPMRDEVIATLHEGDIVRGVARAYSNVGFFIRVGGIVEGLLHNREVRMVGNKAEVIADGAEVEVKVLKLTASQERGRTNIALSRKF